MCEVTYRGMVGQKPTAGERSEMDVSERASVFQELYLLYTSDREPLSVL